MVEAGGVKTDSMISSQSRDVEKDFIHIAVVDGEMLGCYQNSYLAYQLGRMI